MLKIIIPGSLPGLNEIINANKAGIHVYERLKKDAIRLVDIAIIKSIKRQKAPVPADYTITWVCKNRRRDKDNVMGGQKFIFDALQEVGTIPNDGWRQIGDITHRFAVDKDDPRIEIVISAPQRASGVSNGVETCVSEDENQTTLEAFLGPLERAGKK